jgi:hypothetical protein
MLIVMGEQSAVIGDARWSLTHRVCGRSPKAARTGDVDLPTITHLGALAECAEELPDVADEQIGNFHGREVTAPVKL